MKKVLMLILVGLACCVLLTSCAGIKVAQTKYVHNDPVFSIEYPYEWKKDTKEGTLLWVYTGPYKVPQMQIDKDPASTISLEDFAKGLCVTAKKDPANKTGRCKILDSKEITLADGTSAYETYYEWDGDVPLYSFSVSGTTGKTSITSTLTDMVPLGKELKNIPRSLKFK
jgi:hypothetical protein